MNLQEVEDKIIASLDTLYLHTMEHIPQSGADVFKKKEEIASSYGIKLVPSDSAVDVNYSGEDHKAYHAAADKIYADAMASEKQQNLRKLVNPTDHPNFAMANQVMDDALKSLAVYNRQQSGQPQLS